MPANLLVAEDQADIRDLLVMNLRNANYQVQAVADGRAALDSQNEQASDLLILDLMMPEMTGDEMLIELRKKPWGKDVLVIILTNMGEEEAPVSLKSLHVHSFIVKAEMTPRQVAERVKAALAG